MLLLEAGLTGPLVPSSLQILFLLHEGIPATGQATLTPYWKMFTLGEQPHTQQHASQKEAAVVTRYLLAKRAHKTVLHNMKASRLPAFHSASHDTRREVYILCYSIGSQRSDSKTNCTPSTWCPLLPLVHPLEGKKPETRDWKITTAARDNKTFTSKPSGEAKSFVKKFVLLPEMIA